MRLAGGGRGEGSPLGEAAHLCLGSHPALGDRFTPPGAGHRQSPAFSAHTAGLKVSHTHVTGPAPT